MAAQGFILVLLPGIGKLDAQPANMRLIQHRKDEIEWNIEYVGTVPIAPTAMQPYAIAWNSFDRLVDRRNVHLTGRNELRVGNVAIKHRPVHCKIR